jgi:Fur family transcriptional regulator, ferric uptake regulator
MCPNIPFSHAVRSGGLRMTRQRQLILDVITASQEHLDADSIHDLVKIRDTRIGLATVYRTLALLKELGLVQEHKLGEEHGHFEIVQDIPHYHFTCLSCQQVIEFEAPTVVELVNALATREQLLVNEIHLSVRGYCPKCRQNGDSKIDAP